MLETFMLVTAQKWTNENSAGVSIAVTTTFESSSSTMFLVGLRNTSELRCGRGLVKLGFGNKWMRAMWYVQIAIESELTNAANNPEIGPNGSS